MSDRLVNEIIKKLRAGSVKNVVYFGTSDNFPDPPYVVVKPESGVLTNTRSYRISVHFMQGQLDALEDYALTEIDNLLLPYIDLENGKRHKLYIGGYTDITADPSDNTYFMERIYYSPMLGVER